MSKKDKPTPDKEKLLAKIYGNGINITNYFIKNDAELPTTNSMDKTENSLIPSHYLQYIAREKQLTSTQNGKRPKSSSFVRKVPKGKKTHEQANQSMQREVSKE